MSGALHRVHGDVERQHSIEQGCLTIEMKLAEPAIGDFFATMFQ
jgi:hypothetical protein